MEDFSVVVIARNEEHTLPRLLESVRGVSDIVLVDTGSTDNTVKVASDFGGVRVKQVGDKFLNTATQADVDKFTALYGFAPKFTAGTRLFDYGAARNYAMTLAKHDWCFQPDADEVVVWDLEKVRALLPECDQLSYRFCFAHNDDGSALLEFSHCKFFRRSTSQWVKRVHEVVAPLDGIPNRAAFTTDLYLHHWQDTTKDRTDYLPKLEYAILDNPDDDRNCYYLGREYAYAGEFDLTIRFLTHYLNDLKGWIPERSQAQILIGDAYKYSGRGREAMEHYHLAMVEDATRREPFWALGFTMYEWNRFREAAAYLRAALEIPFSMNHYLNDMNLYTWQIWDHLAVVYAQLHEYEQAQECWLQALRSAPSDPRIIANAKWYCRKREAS